MNIRQYIAYDQNKRKKKTIKCTWLYVGHKNHNELQPSLPQSPRCLCQSSFCKIERRHALKSKGREVRKKKKKKKKKKNTTEMQLAREEDDGGGDALKDCFAKNLCICTYLVGFFFSLYQICDCLKVFLIIQFYELFCWFV